MFTNKHRFIIPPVKLRVVLLTKNAGLFYHPSISLLMLTNKYRFIIPTVKLTARVLKTWVYFTQTNSLLVLRNKHRFIIPLKKHNASVNI